MRKRVFLAVPLPEKVHIALEAPLKKLPGKRVPASHWHITLQFFGEIGEATLERLTLLLRTLDLGIEFSITIGQLGAFPDERSAKVLWVGVEEGRQALISFAEHLAQIFLLAGFEVDSRPYIPHLTVRRFFPPRNVSKWIKTSALKSLTFKVTELVLYESILDSGTAQYIPLVRLPLKKSSP